MKKQDFINVGVAEDQIPEAMQAVKMAGKAGRFKGIVARKLVKDVVKDPTSFVNDEHFASLARLLMQPKEEVKLSDPIPYKVWGEIDEQTRKQMDEACRIPSAVAAAVLPDNHLGYSICIGGVLALDNAIFPMGVGVDIGCRCKMSILDLPVKDLNKELKGDMRRGDKISEAVQKGTKFGIGANWKPRCNHPVMDENWNVTQVTKAMKDLAWSQLGTSGSGNHMVDVGIFTLTDKQLGLDPGEYVAIISHSGSRGAGANTCKYYNDIAISKVDKDYKHLAWLSMDSEAGREYWAAMNLMLSYASANHAVIHDNIVGLLGAQVLASVENHHNFCSLEEINGKKLYVHRKGATPSHKDILGIVLGTMADPCFLVRGKGNIESLNSVSHGAGRRMSRTEARKKFNWSEWKGVLKQRGIRLLSAGLDEVPGSYKDIRRVMAQQTDLADIIGEFVPKIVKMSDDGKSED